MLLMLERDTWMNARTWGKLYVDGAYLGETLEDADRRLEDGIGRKVPGETAIPRGKYKVSISFSQRFQRPMPELHDVPDFVGIRIHGLNDVSESRGCPGLGARRTDTGIANCKGVNERLMLLLEDAEEIGEEVWIEIC